MTKVKTAIYRRIFSSLLAVLFLINCVFPSPVVAQALRLPEPGVMVQTSQPFTPALLKGVKVDVDNPFKFEFIVDKGQEALEGDALAEEGRRLIRYFLTALTVPEADAWVNLSPYEKDRIIADALGRTELGRDMLEQDYILKQLTATMIHPESDLGKKFWDKVYADAQVKLGTTDIHLDAFNKVWVMPDKATIYETGSGAYVVTNILKVMTDQDYLALDNHKSDSVEAEDAQTRAMNATTAQMVKEVLIPAITREVNEGKNFANLRQIYNAMLLATWYKIKVKDSILNTTFTGKNKISGAELDDKTVKEQIYRQYLEAFKKGVYSFIKEDLDTYTNEIIPRKYFSGGLESYRANPDTGIAGVSIAVSGTPEGDSAQAAMAGASENLVAFATKVQPARDAAMKADQLSAVDIVRELTRGPNLEVLNKIILLSPREKEAHLGELIVALQDLFSYGSGDKREVRSVYEQLITEANASRKAYAATQELTNIYRNAHADAEVLALSGGLYVVEGRDTIYGVAAIGNKVFIEKAFLDKIRGMENSDERLRALFVQALTAVPSEGVLRYWKKFKSRIINDSKAYAMFGLSKEFDPEFLVKMVEEEYYTSQSESLAKLKALFMSNRITFPDVRYDREDPNTRGRSEELIAETVQFARWTSARYLMNAITGNTRLDVEPYYAFAGSPTTSAHSSGLSSSVGMMGAVKGILSLTGDDYRKAVLTFTKPFRLAMNKIIAKALGGMFDVPDTFLDRNGEERIYIQMFKENFTKRRGYVVGTDHFRFLTLSKFATVTNKNAIDFWHYYRKPGMVYLLKGLLREKSFYGLLPETVNDIERMVASMEDPNSTYQMFKENETTHYDTLKEQGAVEENVRLFSQWLNNLQVHRVPEMDTVPKLWLNNHVLFGENPWLISLLVAPRDPVEADPIRDLLLAGKFSVDGRVIGKKIDVTFLPMSKASNALSSTGSRNALLELLLFRKIKTKKTMTGFFSISASAWHYIFSQPDYQRALLNEQRMPFSAGVLVRKGGVSALNELSIILRKRKINVDLSIGIVKTARNKEEYALIVTSQAGGKTAAFQVHTSVQEFNGEFSFVYTATNNTEDQELLKVFEIFRNFNNADAAQMTKDAAMLPLGGIDFDINEDDLDIQSEGPEIRFNLDPAMLQQGNFDGLIPVILNISPVSDIPLFLGAQQESAPELVAAGV